LSFLPVNSDVSVLAELLICARIKIHNIMTVDMPGMADLIKVNTRGKRCDYTCFGNIAGSLATSGPQCSKALMFLKCAAGRMGARIGKPVEASKQAG
jgi:hypothetical protein